MQVWSEACQRADQMCINNNNLQAFQLIVRARYLLGVPKPRCVLPACKLIASRLSRPDTAHCMLPFVRYIAGHCTQALV